MPRRDVVVIGASAGGIEALRSLLGGLGPDFDGAVFVADEGAQLTTFVE